MWVSATPTSRHRTVHCSLTRTFIRPTTASQPLSATALTPPAIRLSPADQHLTDRTSSSCLCPRCVMSSYGSSHTLTAPFILSLTAHVRWYSLSPPSFTCVLLCAELHPPWLLALVCLVLQCLLLSLI